MALSESDIRGQIEALGAVIDRERSTAENDI